MKNLLTVPNLVMAGVVAIGGYAVYRLAKSKSGDQGMGDKSLALLGDPLHVVQGRYYRARLRVHDVGVPPFLSSASRDDLAAALRVLGFNDVKVFMDVSELPRDWPKSTFGNDDASSRWFQGRWSQGTANLPRPADIEVMWVTAPPAQPAVSGVGRPRKDGGLYGKRYAYGRDVGRGLDKIEELQASDFNSQYSFAVKSP